MGKYDPAQVPKAKANATPKAAPEALPSNSPITVFRRLERVLLARGREVIFWGLAHDTKHVGFDHLPIHRNTSWMCF